MGGWVDEVEEGGLIELLYATGGWDDGAGRNEEKWVGGWVGGWEERRTFCDVLAHFGVKAQDRGVLDTAVDPMVGGWVDG